MADIININDFVDEAQLKMYAQSLFSALTTEKKKNEELSSKVNHLEELLKSVTPDLKPIPIEQVICELQIKLLHEQAMKRSLTLEETKRLDLLVKNLYLAKGKATEIIDDKSNGVNGNALTDDELIKVIKGM